MHILKSYGIQPKALISSYDAFKDEHASSYFYTKPVKKRLKKLRKIIQLEPYQRQYKAYSELLNEKIADIQDQDNIARNNEQKQMSKEILKEGYGKKYNIFKIKSKKNILKTQENDFTKIYKKMTLKNFKRSIQSIEKKTSTLKRSKSSLKQTKNPIKFGLTRQNHDRSTIKIQPSLIQLQEQQEKSLNHHSFINYLKRKKIEALSIASHLKQNDKDQIKEELPQQVQK